MAPIIGGIAALAYRIFNNLVKNAILKSTTLQWFIKFLPVTATRHWIQAERLPGLLPCG